MKTTTIATNMCMPPRRYLRRRTIVRNQGEQLHNWERSLARHMSSNSLPGSNLAEASAVVWLARLQEEKGLTIVSPEKTLLARDSG